MNIGGDAARCAYDRIILVACVARKRSYKTTAAGLYQSTWFRMARRLAEATGSPWFILSAEHGLLAPCVEIEPYDLALSTMGVAERRAWADRVKIQMAERLPKASEVVILAGLRYRENLLPWLNLEFPKVTVPMEGLGIGQQLRWMKHATTL